MKYSTGFIDNLFGKKIMIEMPQEDGTMREVPVTEAWLHKMQAEGKISMSNKQSDLVPFHVVGPDGSETLQLRVGVDIPEAQYKKLRDEKDGALYGLTVYENGEPKTTVIAKEIWEQAKAQLAEIDREGEEFIKGTLDKLKNL